MELLIIRHAKAEDHGHPDGDAARALVLKGRKQAERVGEFLRRADIVPDITLTSPLVRALQTAEILCAAAGAPEPVVQPWLACGLHPDTARRELAAFGAFPRVALVGHEPDLSQLIASLLGAGTGTIDVKKASVSRIYIAGRQTRLLFHLPPALL
jgi:phosphohistidine phosphatase